MTPLTAQASAAPPAPDLVGDRMHALAAELYPLHRSLTGEGVRSTLRRLAREVPLEIHEVPSGTRVFDWTVPDEWTLRDAYVADDAGRRVIDVGRSNLHVVAYSRPVRARMPWRELRERVHTLPERPGWIPYRTGYWEEGWGFCAAHDDVAALDREPDRVYDVVVDAVLAPGALTYGEAVVPGTGAGEILVWTHVCHPSLANDNLSGIVVATELARALRDRRPRHTLRFVFAPATIGAITWLWVNRERLDRLAGGLVLALLGGPGPLTYKRSRRGTAAIDRAAAQVLAMRREPHEIRPFDPTGYDERQFCSPGFDLPVGRLTRAPNGEFPEYHTSADDLDLVRAGALSSSWRAALEILSALDGNAAYRNLKPFGEPRLGPLGLYQGYGSGAAREEMLRAVPWILNLSDGRHDVLSIAERAGLPVGVVRSAADRLLEAGLLAEDRIVSTPRIQEEAR